MGADRRRRRGEGEVERGKKFTFYHFPFSWFEGPRLGKATPQA